MSDTYGLTFYAPLGKWDRDSQSWKTSEATSLWALTLSSLTLPSWGGLHGGELYELPTPALHISGRDYSSLPTPRATDGTKGGPNQRGSSGDQMLPSAVMGFLPTPTASDTNGAGAHGDGGADLRTTVAMLPTPMANDFKDRGKSAAWEGRDLVSVSKALLPTPTSQAAKHGELSPIERDGNRPQDNGNLWVVMPRLAEEALLPTPAVNDMGDGKTLEWWDDWAPRQMSSDGRPAPHGKSLAIEAMRMLPTPRTTDGTDAPANLTPSVQAILDGSSGRTARLSEMAMDWNGESTAPPSTDGKPSSDDQHLGQLSLDAPGIPA